jgi:NADP-dependent 3-hydroxy acid dehydrogenase YdfG
VCLKRDVDILVNAAGVTHYSLLVATQPKLVEEVVGTNLMGTVWGCQVMVKNMIRRKGGILINDSTCNHIIDF